MMAEKQNKIMKGVHFFEQIELFSELLENSEKIQISSVTVCYGYNNVDNRTGLMCYHAVLASHG